MPLKTQWGMKRSKGARVASVNDTVTLDVFDAQRSCSSPLKGWCKLLVARKKTKNDSIVRKNGKDVEGCAKKTVGVLRTAQTVRGC